jgi:hypothetical protein
VSEEEEEEKPSTTKTEKGKKSKKPEKADSDSEEDLVSEEDEDLSFAEKVLQCAQKKNVNIATYVEEVVDILPSKGLRLLISFIIKYYKASDARGGVIQDGTSQNIVKFSEDSKADWKEIVPYLQKAIREKRLERVLTLNNFSWGTVAQTAKFNETAMEVWELIKASKETESKRLITSKVWFKVYGVTAMADFYVQGVKFAFKTFRQMAKKEQIDPKTLKGILLIYLANPRGILEDETYRRTQRVSEACVQAVSTVMTEYEKRLDTINKTIEKAEDRLVMLKTQDYTKASLFHPRTGFITRVHKQITNLWSQVKRALTGNMGGREINDYDADEKWDAPGQDVHFGFMESKKTEKKSKKADEKKNEVPENKGKEEKADTNL